jgi:hypothetical protein
MTPNAITRLFKEDHDAFPPLEGKLSDNDLLAIRETLLPLLMIIPYNPLNVVYSLTAILTKAVKYEANHGAEFVRPVTTSQLLMTPQQLFAEATHKSQFDDYTSYVAAKKGVSKFLLDIVDEIWYNDLKNANTFYTKVTAIDIMALLNTNSRGLHALDMIMLHNDAIICASGWHPPVHCHDGGCTEKGYAGWHAYLRC